MCRNIQLIVLFFRNGALKVYKAYSENPNYGDVNKVKKELIDLAREINQKNHERYNLQVSFINLKIQCKSFSSITYVVRIFTLCCSNLGNDSRN